MTGVISRTNVSNGPKYKGKNHTVIFSLLGVEIFFIKPNVNRNEFVIDFNFNIQLFFVCISTNFIKLIISIKMIKLNVNTTRQQIKISLKFQQ